MSFRKALRQRFGRSNLEEEKDNGSVTELLTKAADREDDVADTKVSE